MGAGLLVTAGTSAGPASAATCTPRLLVLSAMPLELDPVLAQATIDPGSTVVLDNRYFVTGALEGNQVIMGLTGIGPENALATTTAAFQYFDAGCRAGSGITGVVFSGTSGGDYIGDVFVNQTWSLSNAAGTAITATYATDPTMYSVATSPTTLAAADSVLEKSAPTGDPACVCGLAPGATTPVTVTHTPTVETGQAGLTTDPFGGRTLPCAPAGSDVFGCVPCREMDQSQLSQAEAFASGISPFVDPSFFTGYLGSSTPPGSWATSDNETAVVAGIAQANGVPFIGFRAASDGPGNTPGTGGDPLMLPGYPAQFFFYRQLAADNAAATAVTFLQAWAAQSAVAG